MPKFKPINSLLALVLGLISCAVLAGAATNWLLPQPRILAWDYPSTNDLPMLSFNVYTSTNVTLPVSSWTRMTNIPATNLTLKVATGTNGVTVNSFYFNFFQVPQFQFFVVTASNSFYAGESDFSNVTNIPAPPVPSQKFRIQ